MLIYHVKKSSAECHWLQKISLNETVLTCFGSMHKFLDLLLFENPPLTTSLSQTLFICIVDFLKSPFPSYPPPLNPLHIVSQS